MVNVGPYAQEIVRGALRTRFEVLYFDLYSIFLEVAPKDDWVKGEDLYETTTS